MAGEASGGVARFEVVVPFWMSAVRRMSGGAPFHAARIVVYDLGRTRLWRRTACVDRQEALRLAVCRYNVEADTDGGS